MQNQRLKEDLNPKIDLKEFEPPPLPNKYHIAEYKHSRT
jgi:hypothetical protein